MSQDFTDQNAYEDTAGGPQKKKSNALKIVLIILAVCGVLCLVCCGGFAWFGYFAMNKGMEMFADAIRVQYGDHPAVQEHIGELESVESDLFNAAAYEGQMRTGEIPFKVTGPKGEGTIIVGKGAPRAGGQPGVSGGRLLLPSGEVIELD